MANVAQQLDDIRQIALQAVEDDDFQAARKAGNKSLLILSTIPDSSLSGLSQQAWNRSGIMAFLQQLDRMEASAAESGGIVMQPIEYTGRRGGGC